METKGFKLTKVVGQTKKTKTSGTDGKRL